MVPTSAAELIAREVVLAEPGPRAGVPPAAASPLSPFAMESHGERPREALVEVVARQPQP